MLILIFGSISTGSLWSQSGFMLPEGKKEGRLKFELVNNLVIVPVEINNVKLSFLLDTGVSSTLLFGATSDTLELKQTTKVMLRGLGDGEAVEAIKSVGNTIRIGDAQDLNHSLYLVFDEKLNFSPRMGVPIHGILGYDFFKNFVVSINYGKKSIKYTTPENFKEKKKRRYETYPMQIVYGRPFISNVVLNNGENLLMLVDTGSSDGVWVFDDLNITSEQDKNYFVDFLGLGLSGSIYGKRSRAEEVIIGAFKFDNVNVAIPEEEAIVNAKMIEGRDGSIGSQIMKRFNVIFNYPAKQISLKKNMYFKEPFYYNMSGLTLEHDGVTVVKNKVSNSKAIPSSFQNRSRNEALFNLSPTYDISLAPTVIVAEIRENSAAALVDIRVGDELRLINGKPVYDFKLHEITALFSSKEGKSISLVIIRNGEKLRKKFYLTKLF